MSVNVKTKPIETRQSERGYSLVELAIVLLIIGVLMVPATHIYSLYVKEQREIKTQNTLLETEEALNNFRSIYGRYPCPAAANAVPGDANYGRESRNGSATPPTCTAVANGVWSVTSDNTGLANRNVLIGAIPFRQMNLPDIYAYDGDGNRLTYAVTEMLTDDETYSDGNGGIQSSCF